VATGISIRDHGVFCIRREAVSESTGFVGGLIIWLRICKPSWMTIALAKPCSPSLRLPARPETVRTSAGPVPTTNDNKVAYLNTLGQVYASCIYKSPAGFRVLTEEESRSVLRELASPTLVVDPPKQP
jgi:hypothetical protein